VAVVINFSELLWKPGRTRDKGRRSAPEADAAEFEVSSALKHALVEKVALEPNSRVALLMDSQSAGADRFRYLRMRLQDLRQIAKLQSLVITSPLPEDGKSTISMCLATALAEGGKRSTLLIEADLHHPTLGSSLGLPVGRGLAECLESEFDPLSEIRKIEPLGWCLLQAGNAKRNPTELLQSDALSALMRRVSQHFDWILIDSPPALPLTDAFSLSRQVDATLLIARADRTPREAIEETLKLIGRKHVVGIILNGTEGLTSLYSKYYGSYLKK
jgi:capsular exopolysaccharide synthesis family protein